MASPLAGDRPVSQPWGWTPNYHTVAEPPAHSKAIRPEILTGRGVQVTRTLRLQQPAWKLEGRPGPPAVLGYRYSSKLRRISSELASNSAQSFSPSWMRTPDQNPRQIRLGFGCRTHIVNIYIATNQDSIAKAHSGAGTRSPSSRQRRILLPEGPNPSGSRAMRSDGAPGIFSPSSRQWQHRCRQSSQSIQLHSLIQHVQSEPVQRCPGSEETS